jgi:hypothetical protein
MKPKLRLNEKQFARPGSTLGMHKFLHGIGKSPLFDVEFHDETINAMRGGRATVVYYNDKKIYLDLWEYPTPAHTMEVYEGNFDRIMKVQHKNTDAATYNRYCRRKGFMKPLTNEQREEYWNKFIPWTFFPSNLVADLIGREDELAAENYPIEQDCFFCGKAWKCRAHMFKALEAQGVDCTRSSQELRSGRPLNNEEYLHKMRSSKYGLILRGRSSILTDSKNRREIDYMMLKKPLLLDYEPFYYNPMVAGKHFILIDENTRIDSLDTMYNIEEIAQNSYEWYKQNATPEAIPRTFLQIMQEQFE